jgi:ElaB/YqjD/DUF883 family membrane-anchored ribosome-binding protein
MNLDTVQDPLATERQHRGDPLTGRAQQAIRSARQAATQGLDAFTDAVQQAHDQAVPRIEQLGERAETLTRHGIDAARQRAARLREAAHHTQDRTVGYIRAEPIKSVLFAAALGAVLVGLWRLSSLGGRDPH